MRTTIAATLAIAFLTRPGLAGTGELDPTFGTGGITVTTIGTGLGSPGIAMGRQSTGKLVVAGSVGTSQLNLQDDMAVLRYGVDGQLDPTFGTNGVATADFSPFYAYVTAAAVQPDDAIIVVGVGADSPGVLSGQYLLLARFTPDGTLDPTFGTGGRVVGDEHTWMRDVVLQPDGRFVVGGQGGATGRISAVRFEADGTLDATFGTGGIASTTVPCGGWLAAAVAPDGNILLAGQDNGPRVIVVRFDENGVLDPSFGTGGVTALDFLPNARSWANGIVPLADGRIVVSGVASLLPDYSAYHGVARLLGNGTLDPTFSTGGIVTLPMGFQGYFNFDVFYGFRGDIVVDPSGRLVLLGSGTFGPPFPFSMELVRYLPDGAIDTTFGYGGRAPLRAVDYSAPGSLLIDPDGRLVVAGAATTADATGYGEASWAIARYDADCPMFPDADGDGTGDACDACTGGVAPDRAALSLVKIAAPAGDDGFRLVARGQLPPGTPFDPISTGLRIVLDDATGAHLFDATIPGGLAVAPLDVGWVVRGGRYRYRNRAVPPVEGLIHANVLSFDTGEIRLTIKGKRGRYPFGAAALPLRGAIVLDPPHAASGICLDIDFAAGKGCSATSDRLTCRK